MSLLKEKKSFFGRLSERITDTIMLRGQVDEDMMDELEEVLITSDIGMDTTLKIMEQLREAVKKEHISRSEDVTLALQRIMTKVVDKGEAQKLCAETPLVILMIGINGGGKTTSIGKLAHKLKKEGKTGVFQQTSVRNRNFASACGRKIYSFIVHVCKRADKMQKGRVFVRAAGIGERNFRGV